MVYQTSSTDTPLLAIAIAKSYSGYRKATDHLSNTIPETKRWIEEGVIELEPDELKAYLKFVIAPAVVAGKAKVKTLEELVHSSERKNTFGVK